MSNSHIYPKGGFGQIGGATRKKMSKEPTSNYHEIKSGSLALYQRQMANVNDKAFIGKSVKYPFQVKHEKTGKMTTEWMWADVKSVHSNGKLIGKLNNIPWGRTELKLGSRVILDKNLIGIVTTSAQVSYAIILLKSRGFNMDQIGQVLSTKIYPMLTQTFIDKNLLSPSKSKRKPSRKRTRSRSKAKPQKRTRSRSKAKPRKRTRSRSKAKPRKRTRSRSRAKPQKRT